MVGWIRPGHYISEAFEVRENLDISESRDLERIHSNTRT